MNKIKPGCEPILLNGNETGCLLLHGLSNSPYELHLLAGYLHQRGYTVYAPLLPGHGTEPKDLMNLSWNDWFDSAKTALFELRKSVNKIFVLGQSLGGALALHLAAHYEVNGVISMATGLNLKSKLVRFVYPLIPFIRYYYKTSGSDIKADIDTKSYHKIPLRAIHQMLKFLKHLKNDLQDIYAPALIIYSTQDHVIAPKSAVQIYEQIPAKDKRTLKLENCFHVISLDLEKEKVFREVENFIRQIES